MLHTEYYPKNHSNPMIIRNLNQNCFTLHHLSNMDTLHSFTHSNLANFIASMPVPSYLMGGHPHWKEDEAHWPNDFLKASPPSRDEDDEDWDDDDDYDDDYDDDEDDDDEDDYEDWDDDDEEDEYDIDDDGYEDWDDDDDDDDDDDWYEDEEEDDEDEDDEDDK